MPQAPGGSSMTMTIRWMVKHLDFIDAIPKAPAQKIQRFKSTEHSSRMIGMKQFDSRR
jgi:hypothetical protein